MPTAFNDDSNQQRVNLVLHNAGSDNARGLPAVGKVVFRTDTSKVEVCTSTSPNATSNGGGTWTSL